MKKVFEWVDDTNMYISMIYLHKKMGVDLPIQSHCRVWVAEAECYNSEYRSYAYAMAAEFLHVDKDNKVALIRRLFRNSEDFFAMCMQRREECSWRWILDITTTPSEDRGRTNQALLHTLEADLLGFYIEVVHLCLECDLGSPSELYPFPESKEAIEDIVKYTRLTPQEKIEAQKSLRLTKWQDYIIGPKKTQWEQLIAEDISKARNRNGRLVATIITAMQKEGAIIHLSNRSEFYRYLRVDFPNLNTDTAIDNPLNGNSNLITQQEIEKVLKRLENYE